MTIDIARNTTLTAKMLVITHTLRNLILKIKQIESDDDVPLNEKLIQIKKIREEIEKLSAEIDNIKKELTLLRTYNIN